MPARAQLITTEIVDCMKTYRDRLNLSELGVLRSSACMLPRYYFSCCHLVLHGDTLNRQQLTTKVLAEQQHFDNIVMQAQQALSRRKRSGCNVCVIFKKASSVVWWCLWSDMTVALRSALTLTLQLAAGLVPCYSKMQRFVSAFIGVYVDWI